MIYIAIDLGASNGRVLTGKHEKNKLTFQEVHRFQNTTIKKNNKFYWNIDYLQKELLVGLQKVKNLGYEKCYLGIDSWAVDYVITDENGNKLRDVFSYRNFSDTNLIDEFEKSISKDIIYNKTRYDDYRNKKRNFY